MDKRVQTNKTVKFGEQINQASSIRENLPTDRLGLDVGTMNVVGAKVLDQETGKTSLSSLMIKKCFS